MPEWQTAAPSMMDIVAAYFPETNPKGALRLRPCLVTRVLRNTVTGQVACEVAYGTSKLASVHGEYIVVHNTSDLDAMGLGMATIFAMDVEKRATLPWTSEFFGCWTGKKSPRIGALTIEHQKEFAFIIMHQRKEAGLLS